MDRKEKVFSASVLIPSLLLTSMQATILLTIGRYTKLTNSEIIKYYLIEDYIAYMIHYLSHKSTSPLSLIGHVKYHNRHKLTVLSGDTIHSIIISGLVGYILHKRDGFLITFSSSIISQIFLHKLLIHMMKFQIVYRYHNVHHHDDTKNLGQCLVLWDMLYGTYQLDCI